MFSLNHPGGTIGSKLLKVREVMTSEFPIVDPDDDLVAVLTKSTEGRLGMVVVKDKGGNLLGVISDGDVRRTIQRKKEPHLLKAKDMMSPNPITIELDALAVEAANLMETKKITFVCVTNGGDQVGVLHILSLIHI